ncbi:MAG: aminoglycoside phosphotransferase family protein [Clostridiales bacterium]|jgi:fructosamine-3-kinase|nr:aminoglycoside phosphotransferase family protein [Clostridiales bacterium]
MPEDLYCTGRGDKLYKEIRADKLEKIAKDLYGNSTVIIKSELLKGGLFNTTYYVKTNGDKYGIVIRLAPVNKRLLFEFEKDMMSAEPIFHQMLHDNNIKTSKILKYSPLGEVIDREYIVSEYIKSIPMNHPSLKLFPLKSVYREVGAMTRKMHSITSNKFGWLRKGNDYGMFDTWFGFISFFGEELAGKLKSNNILEANHIDRFEEIITASEDILNEIETPRMTHTDLWQGNILLSGNGGEYRVAALIDLDRIIFGDRDWDLATPWMINGVFMKGYGEKFNYGRKRRNRMKIYKIINLLFDCYVSIVEYNDEKKYNKEKKEAIELLRNYNL